jgi:hypothetical protein
MPDDRFVHRRALRSEKVARLTDFERGVWLAYILCADDFGVIRFTAQAIQEALWLELKATRVVQRAFDTLKSIGLLDTFEHQGRTFAFQRDWQAWQNIRHPRNTINPCPPDEALRKCDGETAALFQKHPRKIPEEVPKSSGGSSEVFPSLAHAGTRETANANGKRLTAEGDARGSVARSAHPTDFKATNGRPGDFIDRYKELHLKHRHGAHYVSHPQKDFPDAALLCETYDDERLDKLATVFLTTDHDFAEQGTRTIAKFRSMASWCDERLRAKGL